MTKADSPQLKAKVLRRLEHLDQFGDQQHAREVDIETRDVLSDRK